VAVYVLVLTLVGRADVADVPVVEFVGHRVLLVGVGVLLHLLQGCLPRGGEQAGRVLHVQIVVYNVRGVAPVAPQLQLSLEYVAGQYVLPGLYV